MTNITMMVKFYKKKYLTRTIQNTKQQDFYGEVVNLWK